MRIPIQNTNRSERTVMSAFGGYDRRGDTPEGYFSDMKNMTGSAYPHICPRQKRGRVSSDGSVILDIMSLDIYHKGRIVKNALIADCKNRLKAFFDEDGQFVSHDIFNTSGLFSQDERTVCVSGTRIYFFPDNMYYDMMDSTSGHLDVHLTYRLGAQEDAFYELSLEPCDLDGEDAGEESPYRRLRRAAYTVENGAKGSYIEDMTFSKGLEAGDTVRLAGFEDASLNGIYSIVNIGSDYTSLIFESDRSYAQARGTVYVHRDVPVMDYVIAAGNRLWGCRYGNDNYGNCVNEIYTCALGDPKNWYKTQGVSTDSWSASVSCGGAFTGAVCFDGNPVFFKEDAIIKVFGHYPGEFCITETRQRGIESGSSRSAVFVNDDLYYKTYSGIVRYDGGMPVNVDSALGAAEYKNAVAGAVNGLYYVSMEDKSRRRSLFVYDTTRRTWHKEDDSDIRAFTRCGNELYFLSYDDDESSIYCVSERDGLECEEDFDWMCESGKWGFETPDRKYVSGLQIRLNAAVGARLEVFVEYDSRGSWQRVACLKGDNSAHTVRLRPRRCDHFRVKLCGRGMCTVCSVAKTLELCSSFN